MLDHHHHPYIPSTTVLGDKKHYDIVFYPPELSLKMKDNTNLSNKGAHCTTSGMTANSAYGTTSGIMANLSSTTTAKMWASQNEESIVMNKNPTYATAAETNMARGN